MSVQIIIYSEKFMHSVPISTNVMSLNLAHGEVYSIQYYVIKLVSDFVSGFLHQ
jgi:hypothetical protein